jgi:hypothetical protein
MKKNLFFFTFLLLITSCATNGFFGKGYGPATKIPKNKSSMMIYRPIKKESKALAIVSSNTADKKGLHSNKGAKPPKSVKSNLE